MAPLEKSTKKFRMLQMYKENYESNPKFYKQKGTQCTQYLKCLHNPLMEISLQDMSYKRRHKKVQHSFFKKRLSLKGQVEGKNELNIQGFLWALVQFLELIPSFFQR
jgi:hypothetical protein